MQICNIVRYVNRSTKYVLMYLIALHDCVKRFLYSFKFMQRSYTISNVHEQSHRELTNHRYNSI